MVDRADLHDVTELQGAHLNSSSEHFVRRSGLC